MGDQTTTTPLSVAQPTRDADRNQALAERADPATGEMLLPSLEPGLTLLDVEGGRGVPIVQSLVLDHLLLQDGSAVWVDAKGYAATTTLARIAPSQRLLDRIHVARGFTAYQHFGAVWDLPTALRRARTDTEGATGPSLIVAPAVDAMYREDDTLATAHAKTLQARTLARLAAYADGYDVPVLLTRSDVDAFTAPVATIADHHLTCEQTRMGPRVVGEDFETVVYPVAEGAYYQTTFAYWRQLLAARADQVGFDPATESPPTPEATGTGVTVDGDAMATAADPLLDAWTTSAGRR